MKRHGHSWKGGSSPTYRSWSAMKRRCRPDGHYGIKGIRVCERWTDFRNFLADMGERPDGTTIDRIDNARGYEPGNCRWATLEVQLANRALSREKCPRGCTCQRHAKRVRTPEHCAKIRASKVGHSVSAETRAKIGAAFKGKTLTPEHRAKISAGLNRHHGTA